MASTDNANESRSADSELQATAVHPFAKLSARAKTSEQDAYGHVLAGLSTSVAATWLPASGGAGRGGRGGGRSMVAWELSGCFACCYL